MVEKAFFFTQNTKKINLPYLLCPKNTLEKIFEFLTKTVDKPFWKIMIFLICLKFHFSFLKNILLYPEYEKRIFSSLFCPKNTNNKTFDLLTKTMDLLLWDISIFLTFSKPHLSGIKNILFYPEYQKTVFFDLIRQKMRFRKRSIF